MSVQFFGQFLVERGLLKPQQLVEALNRDRADSLAKLAVAKGAMEAEAANELLERVAKRGLDFGETAVKNSLISQAQLDYLLFLQKSNIRELGHALIQKGFIDPQTLADAKRQFDTEQQAFTIDAQDLPPSLSGRADVTALLSMTVNILSQHGLSPVRTSPPTPLAAAQAFMREVSARVAFSGDWSGRYVLSADRQLASIVSAQMLGGMEEADGSMAWDAVRELANLIAGAAISALAQRGHEMRFSPPSDLKSGASPGLMPEGAWWVVETPWGAATVLMD